MTEPFVLKRDVLLVPCAELPEETRNRIDFGDGDFTLSRRRSRTFVQVIDGDTAALLALFREPRTIVSAVVENSRSLGRDPRTRLEEMLPHIGSFLEKQVLVPAGSDQEEEAAPQFVAGDRFGRWEIVRCASFMEDSEVYQVRDGADLAALKIARVERGLIRLLFANEVAVLRRLGRIIDAADDHFVTTWIDGVDAMTAAAQRRHDRGALAALCASIANAYADLHEQGILHGDVHARNLIMGDRVTLLDFGYARLLDEQPLVGRGGMYYFFEPEYVSAPRSIPASAAGEQYGVAALLYYVLTGHHYLDFRYDRAEMERQVVNDPPLPFAARGVPPWPDVETILFRALEKDPSRRFRSMRDFASALAAVHDRLTRESVDAALSADANAFLAATIQSFAHGGEVFTTRYPTAPHASINFGAAGAAVGLLRIAETRSDPKLLALAAVWLSRATALIGTHGAFHNADRGLSSRHLGQVSPYHTESGVHAAAAMLACAVGEPRALRQAVASFVRASGRACDNLDLTLGRSGSLLAASLLLPLLPDDEGLRTFGTETMRSIWDALDAQPPIADAPPETFLGMAHGWAGFLFATMRWSEASGAPLPPRFLQRFEEHASLGIRKGLGMYWRSTVAGSQRLLIPGWCHGSAGRVFLFTQAHKLLGDSRWLELAELCAWNNWEEPLASTNLCCGSAGRAYAMLNLYKHTGATEWLHRARHLANHAALHAPATTQRPNALWKGELGVAVLIADLASPENARMPFFE
ncbi:MAG TPA: lanthionine synthetase LanC family protein [Thermoanaerobaculia bacterium]|nr:lanthionine synthetase LanC family protein [Thermoanaerobaculia bacterium]